MLIMYALYILLLYFYADQSAFGIVLRNMPSTRNTLHESEAECQHFKTKMGSIVEVKETAFDQVKDIQDSLNIQPDSSSDHSTTDDRVISDQLMIHSFAQSDIELDNFENIDNTSSQAVSDLIPTVGFEFLIASEALKKANVIEELATSVETIFEVSDDDDFDAFLITEQNDCEEIHTVEYKDSETKSGFLGLASLENISNSFDGDILMIEANQSSHNVFALLPEQNTENVQANSSIFENANEDGSKATVIIQNLTSEMQTMDSKLESTFPSIVQDSFSSPTKVPEVTELSTGKHIELAASNEVSLEELKEGIETTANNLFNRETLVTDSSVTISKEEKKCPPGGFCLFSFTFRDTCTKHSDCRGNRLCCKSGCSKKCLDL